MSQERISNGMKLEQVVAPPLDNNIYVLGNSKQVLLIDAAGDMGSTAQVKKVVGDRSVQAILITHGHFDHIQGKDEFKKFWPKAPVYLHPNDLFLWQKRYPGTKPDDILRDRVEFKLGNSKIVAMHTPGHTPGSTCFYWEAAKTVFTGDTLFPGGPGATRWGYSSFDQIIKSVDTKLFSLPEDTKVLPGHGKSTSIGTEKANLPEWISRGW